MLSPSRSNNATTQGLIAEGETQQTLALMSAQTPLRPSPLSFDSPRTSPFKRQNSSSPSTLRATTPTHSPTKSNGPSRLSPEKASPFVRRPSQNSLTSGPPSSPFARPSSRLSIPASPSRQASYASQRPDALEAPQTSPSRGGSALSMSLAALGPDPPSPGVERITRAPSPSPASTDAAVESPATAVQQQSPLSTTPSLANLQPSFPRTTTSSTIGTIRQPIFTASGAAAPARPAMVARARSNGGYGHVPAPLLRSMRESFEVLDSSNCGTVNGAAVSTMLEQLGLDADTRDFFAPSQSQQLNLARYLDTLSAPLAELSHSDELTAAFGAFDVDDSGQIDLSDLKDALLHTAQEPGEPSHPMSEGEIDGILGDFAGRRAFGGKGLSVAGTKGEVFRYRDFMAHVRGGAGDAGAAAGSIGT